MGVVPHERLACPTCGRNLLVILPSLGQLKGRGDEPPRVETPAPGDGETQVEADETGQTFRCPHCGSTHPVPGAELAEIKLWFNHRGHELVVHEHAGEWRAPYMPLNSRFGAAAYGSGVSALDAALNAQEQFDREHPPRAVRATAGFFIESDAPPAPAEEVPVLAAEAEAYASAPELIVTPEVSQQVEEALLGYGWTLWFEPEPDGKITAVVRDVHSGQILRTDLCDDHEDAFLTLGINLRPPSNEVREELERRQEGNE